MRSLGFVLPLLLVGGAMPASADCTANSDIEAAFAKQLERPAWRTVVTSVGNAGKQEQTFDYVPPDKMYRKVVVEGDDHPVETIAIGKWAWSTVGGPWSEMQPQFAQLVTTHMQSVFETRKVTATFSCLGTVSLEGKDYLGYQTAPEDGGGGEPVARTIYVDPATGLPAFNVIGPTKPGAAPVVKEAYSYPTDIVIEKPLD